MVDVSALIISIQIAAIITIAIRHQCIVSYYQGRKDLIDELEESIEQQRKRNKR